MNMNRRFFLKVTGLGAAAVAALPALAKQLPTVEQLMPLPPVVEPAPAPAADLPINRVYLKFRNGKEYLLDVPMRVPSWEPNGVPQVQLPTIVKFAALQIFNVSTDRWIKHRDLGSSIFDYVERPNYYRLPVQTKEVFVTDGLLISHPDSMVLTPDYVALKRLCRTPVVA
jgi:hypothetical protein